MVHSKHRGKAAGFTDALYAAAALAARRAGARFLLLNCTPALAPMCGEGGRDAGGSTSRARARARAGDDA